LNADIVAELQKVVQASSTTESESLLLSLDQTLSEKRSQVERLLEDAHQRVKGMIEYSFNSLKQQLVRENTFTEYYELQQHARQELKYENMQPTMITAQPIQLKKLKQNKAAYRQFMMQ
jgi:hypothetical protein